MLRLSITLAMCVMAYVTTTKAEALAPQTLGFRIIVNPANPTTAIDRRLMTDAFLKRKTAWTDGEVIRPIDLAPDSPVRVRFTALILGRTVTQVRNYWQQRIFSGRELPPLELQSEQEVVKYVLAYRGAVGYVSAMTDVGAAKVLVLREE